jgi:hypothetical protein
MKWLQLAYDIIAVNAAMLGLLMIFITIIGKKSPGINQQTNQNQSNQYESTINADSRSDSGESEGAGHLSDEAIPSPEDDQYLQQSGHY